MYTPYIVRTQHSTVRTRMAVPLPDILRVFRFESGGANELRAAGGALRHVRTMRPTISLQSSTRVAAVAARNVDGGEAKHKFSERVHCTQQHTLWYGLLCWCYIAQQ